MPEMIIVAMNCSCCMKLAEEITRLMREAKQTEERYLEMRAEMLAAKKELNALTGGGGGC